MQFKLPMHTEHEFEKKWASEAGLHKASFVNDSVLDCEVRSYWQNADANLTIRSLAVLAAHCVGMLPSLRNRVHIKICVLTKSTIFGPRDVCWHQAFS